MVGDRRALAACRGVVALLLLYDLLQRWLWLEDFQGATGLIPRAAVPRHCYNLHEFLDGPGLHIMMLLQVLLALALLLGYKSRWVGWFSWLGLLSLHLRAPYILYGADRALLLTLFWGNFLPWGERYSWDEGAPSNRFRSWAVAAMWGQLAFIYWQTAWLKSGAQWWHDHTAVYHALTALQYQTGAGAVLREVIVDYPALGYLFTILVLVGEYLLPALLLWSRARNLAVAGLLLLHLGISLTLHVGYFPWISMAMAGALFLPPSTEEAPPDREGTAWALIPAVLMLACSLMPLPRDPVLRALQLQQRWNMFSPEAPRDHGWYSARGVGLNGQSYELLVDGRVEYSTEIPYPVWASVANMRISSFCFRLYTRNNLWMGPLLCNYLLQKWERQHPDKPLVEIELIYHTGRIVPYLAVPLEPRVIYREPVV